MINGNKFFIGNKLLNKIIELYPDKNTTIYEPFVGGFGMTSHLLQYYNNVVVSDINPVIIILINEILFNNFKIPTDLNYYSREKYNHYKKIYKAKEYFNLSKHDKLEFTLIGLVCSVMKSFYNSGYNGELTGRNFRQSNLNYILKIINILDSNKHKLTLNINSLDYSELEIKDNNYLLYCDIPYKVKEDKQYNEFFNHEKFYDYCKNKNILISEYNMPDNFESVLSIKKYSAFSKKYTTENLYKLRG